MSLGADKAPTFTHHLKEQLEKMSEATAGFTKMQKFQKIDGKPATYGA